MNVGYMIYFGRDWAAAMGRAGHKHILIYDDISMNGGRNIRPMVTESAVHDYRTFSSCNNAAGICGDEFGHHFATDYPDRHSFQIQRFQEQWLYVEFEVVIGGSNTLYVFSRDGRLAHRIGRINNINVPAQPLWYVRLLAYFGDRTNPEPTTSNSYVLIDNLVVNNHFMGPPQGFVVR